MNAENLLLFILVLLAFAPALIFVAIVEKDDEKKRNRPSNRREDK